VRAVTPWNATRFALKHTIAAATVIAGMVVCAAVSFVVGVLMIAARDGDTTTFPSTILFGLLTAVASVVLVLMPITSATELLCQRARLRLWWQIPLSLAMLAAVGAGLAAVSITSGATLPTSVRIASLVSAALVIPLAVYWWALQSTDWVLRTSGDFASRMSPSRFGALSTRPELMSGGRPVPVRAHFLVRDHVCFTSGSNPALVIVGDVVDGGVRGGMRVFASLNSTELSATIVSVDSVGRGRAGSHVGLLLTLNAYEQEQWKAAAVKGQVVKIA